MYPQNEMAALVLARAFEDELVHIKEAGVLRDAAVFAKKRVGRVAKRAKRVYEEGSPFGVRSSLGMRTPLQAEQAGRIKELNRLALAQRAASVQRPAAQGTGAVGGSGLAAYSDPNNIQAAIQRGRQFAATRNLKPLAMPQPTALQMRQKVQGRVGNVATPASRPSQGVVGPIREANRASLQRMRARRDASQQQAGGFGRMMRLP